MHAACPSLYTSGVPNLFRDWGAVGCAEGAKRLERGAPSRGPGPAARSAVLIYKSPDQQQFGGLCQVCSGSTCRSWVTRTVWWSVQMGNVAQGNSGTRGSSEAGPRGPQGQGDA